MGGHASRHDAAAERSSGTDEFEERGGAMAACEALSVHGAGRIRLSNVVAWTAFGTLTLSGRWRCGCVLASPLDELLVAGGVHERLDRASGVAPWRAYMRTVL